MGAIKSKLLEDWSGEVADKRESAVAALVELVEGPVPGENDRITDAHVWVHTAFYTYRSSMDDNDPRLPRLARIEYDFIEALGAMNFGDQARQLREALRAIKSFPA